MKRQNRRSFLKATGTVAASTLALPTIIPGTALGKNGRVAPSDRITMGFIGCGNQAENDGRGFLEDERVQIIAVCDVNEYSSDGYWAGKPGGRKFIKNMVETAYADKMGKKYKGCDEYTDFRELLDRKDIDAVEIVTPDHWHAIPVMMAAARGKDIYCQKPLSLTVEEGRDMANAVQKHHVVFQTGSQQRSNEHFIRVHELILNGYIGELQTVRCGLPGGVPDFSKKGDQTETVPVPDGFDYDMWLGPAPEAPYCPARTHVNYRWILDYSGGQVTDWGGHHPDCAQWAIGAEDSGPIRIQNARVKWSDHPLYNTATEFYFECLYENGVKLVIGNGERFGVTYEGTEGTLWAARKDHEVPEKLKDVVIGDNDKHVYRSYNHYRNFIDCVISRERTAAPAEVGHRSITVAHLGNIAMMLGQDLEWDPKSEEFPNNFAANQFLNRKMRDPWNKVYLEYKV